MKDEYWDNGRCRIDSNKRQETRGVIPDGISSSVHFCQPDIIDPAHICPFPFLFAHTSTCQTQSTFKEVGV